MKHAHLFACSAAATLAVALLSGPALAQSSTPGTSTAPSTADAGASGAPAADIVVTGSRIRHSPLDQPAPVTFVDKTDIDRTGLSSIADVLQRLPSSGGGLNTRNNSSGNFGNPPDGGGVGAGSSEINLRYLGSKRTLVLVDSMRFINGSAASGIPAAVDLNAIPQAAIERVEVLQDGASAIYGSDAISGVVNIITKTKQDGFEGSAQNGIFKEGDGFTQNYDLSYGFKVPSLGTQVVLGGSYVQQDPVFSGDRAFSTYPYPHGTICTSSCSSATPNGRFLENGNNLTLIAPVTGRAPTLADYRNFTTPDRYNYQPLNYLATPYKRYSAFANVEQPLGDSIKLSGKFFFNRRESENQAGPLPLFIGPDAGNSNLLDTITFAGSNPYNPFGTLHPSNGPDDPANYNFIARRLVEGGPRHYSQQVDTYYGTLTLSGQFRALDHDWFWDVNGVYGKTNARQSVTGNVNAARVAEALGPDCTGACVPLNLFGGAGTITPAMYNYIAFTQHDRSSQTLWDATANLSGALFDLPAGPVGLALGYEHRDLKGSFVPDPIIQAGLGADIPASASSGEYHADEVYGELSVPILKDKPFFEMLDGSFAARYSKYSIGGSKTTFKAGGDWKPVEDLLLRGSWSQGFRAPSIAELFGSRSRYDDVANDPCNDVAAGSSPASLVANCGRAGVATDGSYEQNNNQLPVFTVGNRDLKPESSQSWVGGAVYSASWASSFAKTLTFEASYFNIKVKHAIGAVDTTTRLNSCYVDDNADSCSRITRSASGQITAIEGTLLNLDSLKTDGLDLNFNYRSPTGNAGSFGLSSFNTLLFSYDEKVPAGVGAAETLKRAGKVISTQAFPKFKSTTTASWTLGGFTASLTGRYISAVQEVAGNEIGHDDGRRLYGDIQLLWDTKLAERDFTFSVGVNNLVGTAPPACYSCLLNNYDPNTYDVPGQFFYARVAVKM